MHEIPFRGKSLADGKWVFGDLYHRGREVVITSYYTGHHISVDPATVGQFTGLMANGKRIFEGDIFEWGYAGVKKFRYVVVYDANIASFVGERHFGFVTLNGIDIEIIGNIHDNPELLEVTPDE